MSEQFAFSVKSLKAFAARNKDRRASARDASQRGLIVDLRSDRLTFYLYRRIGGRPSRYRIGPFPEVTVEQARDSARKLIGRIAAGENPIADRNADRFKKTLGGLWAYWTEYAKPRKATFDKDQNRYDAHLKGWENRKLADILPADIEALHNRLGTKNGIYEANRVFALLKAMFNRADKVGYRGPNPCKGIKPFPEEKRERFLQPDELPRFFAALDSLENQDMADVFRVALLTGQRKANVLEMRWRELDLANATWRFVQKGGRPLLVPLSPHAVAVLKKRQKTGASDWVFPSWGRTGHITEPKGAWAKLLAAAELKGVRMHDLRRTLGSWQAGAGVSELIIGKSLGHAPGSAATMVYARLHLDPVRAAVDAAGDAIVKAGRKKQRNKK